MKKEDLFRIREKNGLEFESIKPYLELLKDIFYDVESIPFVYGYKQFGPKDWELISLGPKKYADKITLMNYVSGVEAIIEDYRNTDENLLKFRRGHIELGIDTRTRNDLGETIITTGFEIGGRSYRLNIRWELNENSRGKYSAESTIFVPRAQAIMERHIGPNMRINN